MVTQAHEVGDSTLFLPRILCLHGGGTNARIFRMQCRVLEGSLRSAFRLVYAQAPFPAQPGSDVTSVYKKYGPFKAWQRSTLENPEHDAQDAADQIDAALNAAMRADDLRGATGEWVALLGFSQGAKIAASILYSQQVYQQWLRRRAFAWPDFRFALLMAGRGPLVWLTPQMAMPQGLVDAAHPSMSTYEPILAVGSHEHVLRVPTIHVHGLQDPGLELHRKLLNQYCDPRSVSVLEWDGEHRVPIKTKNVNAVVEQVFFVARETGVLSPWS